MVGGVQYEIAPRGLATEFSLSELPPEFASVLKNRFININGDTEKRQGLKQLGNNIPGSPEITGIHEHISTNRVVSKFASANGKIWKYDASTGDWNEVLSGKDANQRLFSVQMDDKLIFVNGVDRNFYTDDGGATFKELQPIVNIGKYSNSSGTQLVDSNISSWPNIFVAVNDLVYNATKDGYGLVTTVSASTLGTTLIGTTGTGLGLTSVDVSAGDRYEIYDLVELNIIPSETELDNVAIAASGTNTSVVAVSGVDFSDTSIRVGDYVSNTTRNAVSEVKSVSANINVTDVSGMIAGDSLVFLKKAMPIATWAHVHYKRLYLIDSRDETKVRVSGPDNPQDFTTFTKTLSSTSIDYGALQPQAEKILTLATHQRYLVAGGERNVFVYDGVDPIQDVVTKNESFTPIGLFPQGCVSRYGLATIGTNMTFAAVDGLRAFSVGADSGNLVTDNLSEFIKTEISTLIKARRDNPDEIQAIHYPQRNWVLFKVGSTIYNYNYTPRYQLNTLSGGIGSWSTFTGTVSGQNVYFIDNDGTLICAGNEGKVYTFDTGSYSDDGLPIPTVYETAWLNLNEGTKDAFVKDGRYIKPVFETAATITYTIKATGDFQQESSDEISVTADGGAVVGKAIVNASDIGGNLIADPKLPLRWRGEQFKVRFETENTLGPDVISRFTVYGNIHGFD